MDLSEFTIRLVIVLIPGLLSTIIVETISFGKKLTQFRFIVVSILLGGLTYLLMQCLYWLLETIPLLFSCDQTHEFTYLKIWGAITSNNSQLDPGEIVFSLPTSILLGYIVGALIHYKFVTRMAFFFRASNRFGDESLIMHYLNDRSVNWVYVRDNKNDLSYRGQINKWAEDGEFKEIVLLNVTVFQSSTGTELYKMSRIYLRFQGSDLRIEESNN